MWQALWAASAESDGGSGRAQPEPSAKVILIGDSFVGKSSLLSRFTDGAYDPNFIATVGVDFRRKRFDFSELQWRHWATSLQTIQTAVVISGRESTGTSCDHKPECKDENVAPSEGAATPSAKMKMNDVVINVQFYDTAGQERFQSMTSSYYRSATGVMLVYDVTSMESLLSIPRWAADIDRYCHADGTNISRVLIGNKCDELGRVVSEEDGRKMADRINALFVEVSAKTGMNVDDAFAIIARDLLELAIEANGEEKGQAAAVNKPAADARNARSEGNASEVTNATHDDDVSQSARKSRGGMGSFSFPWKMAFVTDCWLGF